MVRRRREGSDRGGRAASILAVLALAAGLGASRASAADVAVLLSADVPAYREAVAGFEKASGHRIVRVENMDGRDIARGRRILEDLASEAGLDLILAVGVWALEAVAETPLSVPVMYTMVLNPPSVLDDRAGAITGSSMNVPVAMILDLVSELGGDVRRVGAIYNPKTTGYLIAQAEALMKSRGMQLEGRPIGTPAEALKAVDDLEGSDIDALWILPEADTLGDKIVDRIFLLSYRRNVPVIGLSADHAKKGAVVALTFATSEDIGRQAGELSAQVLANRKAPPAFTMVRSTRLVVNLKAARKLGVTVPEELTGRATEIIP